MTSRRALVLLDGFAQELPANDSLAGSLSKRPTLALSGAAGQKTFSVPGGYSLLGGYALLDVSVNGVTVTEFAATDGSTFTLAEGLDSPQDEVSATAWLLNGAGIAPVRVENTPVELAFGSFTSTQYRVPAPAKLIMMNDPLTADTGQFKRYTEATQGNVSVSGGALQISHSGGPQNDIVAQTSAAVMIPQVWVEATIDVTDTGSSGYDNGSVGITKDANNFLFTNIDRINSTLRIQLKLNGSNYFINEIGQSWGRQFKLALSLVSNTVGVWVDNGSGWVCRISLSIASWVDFRILGALDAWYPCVSLANGGGNSVWRFSNFRMGRYGGVSIRDTTLVTNEDGTPYLVDQSKVHFTATVADPAGNGISSSYQAVFSYDVLTKSLEQTAVIFVNRDGRLHNDHAGHIVRLSDGRFRITIGSWGNGFGNSLQTYTGVTDKNLLSGGHALALSLIALPGQPNASSGAYDSFAAYDSDKARWLIAYTITDNTGFSGNPFYAALCSTTDWVNFTLIGTDRSRQGYEGTKLLRNNNQFFVLAGGPAGSGNSSAVYDASMAYLGSLKAVFQGGGDTQPHPMVFPVGDTQYLMTFNNNRFSGSFTWGDLQVATAQRYRG